MFKYQAYIMGQIWMLIKTGREKGVHMAAEITLNLEASLYSLNLANCSQQAFHFIR